MKKKGIKPLKGGKGDDSLKGTEFDDVILGNKGDDYIEAGAGNDVVNGNDGDDHILSISWGGEPVPAQDADAQYYDSQPVPDNDIISGGDGADTFEFRWLIHATPEITEKHTTRDDDGNIVDIDYSGGGIAGENGETHLHWVESMGDKVVTDYNADEGDTLIFEGHTVEVGSAEQIDTDGDGELDSTIFTFVSNQGGNGGAHDGDEVGTVTFIGNLMDADDIEVNAGVNYGYYEVDDPNG